MASLDSGDIFFNHLTGDIENEHGSILKLDVRPSANTLNHYLKTVHSLPPPKLVRRGNLSVIEDDPEVAYDPRERALGSRGWPAAELARREAAQWPLDQKRALAHHVLCNDGDPQSLRSRVKAALADTIRTHARAKGA